MKQPLLFCFAAPTASGKTTITKELVRTVPNLTLSLSTTTRAPRPGEVEGREYFFVSDEDFQRLVQAGKFLEHAEFSGKHYGTGVENLSMARERGCDLVLDIDIQGVEQIRKLHPNELVVVFVFPPSLEILKSRLRARGTEDEEKMKRRLEAAEREIAQLSSPGFADYFLMNDELEVAIQRAKAIIEAERLRANRQNFSDIFRQS